MIKLVAIIGALAMGFFEFSKSLDHCALFCSECARSKDAS